MPSPDYLNNLSPDSKEYEDTQGKTQICSTATRRVSNPGCWGTDSERLYWTCCTNISPLFLCLSCSCLGDRLWGGRPGQRQSETGGEFTLDAKSAGYTLPVVVHIPPTLCRRYWDLSFCCAWQRKSKCQVKLKGAEVRQSTCGCVWIPLLNHMLERRRGLFLFADCWCDEKATSSVPSASLQREQRAGLRLLLKHVHFIEMTYKPSPHCLCSLSLSGSPVPQFGSPPLTSTFLRTHRHGPSLCLSSTIRFAVSHPLPPFTLNGSYVILSPLASITGLSPVPIGEPAASRPHRVQRERQEGPSEAWQGEHLVASKPRVNPSHD